MVVGNWPWGGRQGRRGPVATFFIFNQGGDAIFGTGFFDRKIRGFGSANPRSPHNPNETAFSSNGRIQSLNTEQMRVSVGN